MQPNSTETNPTGNGHSDKAPENRIEELEAQLKEKDAKYLYLYAEFENFKKRAIKERSDLMKFGWETQARELLQVIDNLERALTHMPASTDKVLVDGLNMVIHQFRATLQKQGVERVESLDKPFDPNLHEAVAQEQSDAPAGTILKEHQGGYTLHGRLLRPSRVVVSSGKQS
jgi:molecular chaperone GrpE